MSTVRINKPAINLREELTDLRNQGFYQEQQFYFDSLITNGTFDSDISGWTDNSTGSATISFDSGSILLSGTNGSNEARFSQEIITNGPARYQISFDATVNSGGFSLGIGSSASNSGTLSELTLPSGTSTFMFYTGSSTRYVWFRTNSGGGNVNIDNISVFEVDANDDVIHTMPKGWKPKDVFEDGLLQREGAANDYEVVYDGFDYYVKPAVAPSATTQTCVIGVRT